MLELIENDKYVTWHSMQPFRGMPIKIIWMANKIFEMKGKETFKQSILCRATVLQLSSRIPFFLRQKAFFLLTFRQFLPDSLLENNNKK